MYIHINVWIEIVLIETSTYFSVLTLNYKRLNSPIIMRNDNILGDDYQPETPQ